MTPFARIGVEQAEALLTGQDNVMLLDTRDARAYCQGHDPRAIHLSDLNLRTLLKVTPKQVHLVFCCADGDSSPDMARLFGEFGFTNCYSLEGGYAAWQARPSRAVKAHGIRAQHTAALPA
ncbi:thiosulfate sulfurtransferase GlpE [Azotobacter beijerinckii]|uniref:Thiosulfate sulfurtransferase n=1 Tax=Azotobacter beijerinckii TaxID=170623 RepID=A0A1I4AYC5_9GAMM|nr:thiosulfate sulfurtransferase GlpE [Azotobacter beijerinckii]SFB03793.1 thiosulfate sulfurtransferase [Azotobacter beijerinckii]SFK61568.1 thiosulfate sulfurtransferase [Azotobacter beijerinckii]